MNTRARLRSDVFGFVFRVWGVAGGSGSRVQSYALESYADKVPAGENLGDFILKSVRQRYGNALKA